MHHRQKPSDFDLAVCFAKRLETEEKPMLDLIGTGHGLVAAFCEGDLGVP
jgi:hypothetical protein